MGRPSVADERRPQVLEAFARCVARAGFAGTSLSDVAQESGMARGHIRHYLGNRHDQMVALAHWAMSEDENDLRKHLEQAPQQPSLGAFIAYLFDEEFYRPGLQNRLLLALFEEATRDEELREVLRDSYTDLLARLTEAFAEELDPGRTQAAGRLAYLMVCAAMGNAHMAVLGAPVERTSTAGQAASEMCAAKLKQAKLESAALDDDYESKPSPRASSARMTGPR